MNNMIKEDNMKLQKLKEYCINKWKACETYPFGEIPICYKLNGKVFAQIYPNPEDYKITLKCTADAGQFYRQVYPGAVVRGYHCPPVQQPYWNTVFLDKIPEEEILNMIDQAYDTVLQSFSKKVQKQILDHLYSFCGDDCSVCPRYTAHTEAELERVAELWHRAGWRNRILPAEEMKCSGCSLDKECGFHLVECIKEHAVEKCNQCEEYPCEKIRNVLHKMEQSMERCKEVCSADEFAVLKKAFFEKRDNLER